MFNKFRMYSIILVVSFLWGTVKAQEFPIAEGTDTTFSSGAVYGGQNGIVAIYGDASSQYSITAQLVGVNGTSGYVIGSRISLNAQGAWPGAVPIFDGTNYFLVWRAFNSTLRGQFINTSGNLVGSAITIATNVLSDQKHSHKIICGDTIIFATFFKTDGFLYAQRVRKTGELLGNEIQINNSAVRDISVSFDGTNFLVVWVDDVQDKNIYGQFVSKNGALVGSTFLIDGDTNYSDNPTALAFDGTRYLLVYHEAPTLTASWTIVGRFLTTTGTVSEPFTVCDSSKHPALPTVDFDGTNYLVTWSQFLDGTLMGRFFSTSGIPVAQPFVLFEPLNDKIPIGGIGFGGGLYLAVASRLDASFDDGDVYGKFISPLTTGLKDDRDENTPKKFFLYQNFPNPFNPTTRIRFEIPVESFVSLKVFDVIGREVATLVNEKLSAGEHAVQWNAGSMPSGVYFYRLQTGNYSATKKLMLIK